MAEITAQMVKELRAKTDAGMMDCKKALAECDGDFAKAEDLLREKGMSKAAKKSDRQTTEGIVATFVHTGRIGVIVEVNSETDFAAKNERFVALSKDIAFQLAALSATYIKREDVPAADIAAETARILAALATEGKSADLLNEELEKFYTNSCLLEQSFIKNPEKKMKDVLVEAIAIIGENIQIRRFTRYVLGEGIEKKVTDFAAEVAATAGVKN